MDIKRLRQLAGTSSNTKSTAILNEAFDQATKEGIERNKGRRGKPVLGPKGNELENTVVLNDRGSIIGVRAAGGMTIVIYETLTEEKSDFFLPDEAIDTLGSIEA